MNCIVELNGREAIPVRAIPYITGWGLSPDRVASSFAQKDTGFKRLGDLKALHISPDGSIGELPKEWDGIEDMLEALHLELEAKNPDHNITCPEWLDRSVPLLPSSCFVWRDAFEEKYHAARGRITFAGNQRPGDADLNFNPRIPPEHVNVVFEGMPGGKSLAADKPIDTPEKALAGAHYSEELNLLIQAADRFWKNADPKESDTHPTNKDVAEWLMEQGMVSNRAEIGATIIRPKWAAKGRRKEK
jgi:hypothetical protein